MAYDPRLDPARAPAEPDRGSLAGFAAIKYTAIIIIVLAIIGFLVWAISHFSH
jgi:hypothetical protein